MFKNILLLLLISILGCSKKGEAFLAVEEISQKNEILIFPLRPLISELGNKDELLVPNPIRIKDPATIERIINEWGKNKSGHPGFPFYKVLLNQSNEVIRSVSLNKELSGMFTGHGYYQFSKEELFQHEHAFEKLSWVNIKLKSLEDSRKLISALYQQKYIYTEFIYPNGDFQLYSGEFKVRVPSRPSVEDYEPILQKELNDTTYQLILRSDVGADSVDLTIRTMKPLTTYLPNDYTLISDWMEYEDIEVDIVGIDKNQVVSTANKLGINAEIK